MRGLCRSIHAAAARSRTPNASSPGVSSWRQRRARGRTAACRGWCRRRSSPRACRIAERLSSKRASQILHRPLALGLGFLRRVVELAGDALGVDLADQHVALRARHAGGRGGLGADLAEDHVDAPLAVVGRHRAVAGRVARQADAETRPTADRASRACRLGNRLLRRRFPFRIVGLAAGAAGAILRRARCAAVSPTTIDSEPRDGCVPCGRNPPQRAVAALIVHGQRLQGAFLEGLALDVVACAVKRAVKSMRKPVMPRESDLVAGLDLACVLGQRGCRRGAGTRQRRSRPYENS